MCICVLGTHFIISNSSVAIAMKMQQKQIIFFQEEVFQQPAQYQYWKW